TAGVPRSGTEKGVCRRHRGRNRLCLPGRAGERARGGRRGRPAAAEGDDLGGSRARRGAARRCRAMIVDYHLHLRDEAGEIDFSRAAVERFVQAAGARGVDEIGFTEHDYYFRETRELWRVPYLSERCRFELDSYCGPVLDAKSNGLPVKLGLEVDY